MSRRFVVRTPRNPATIDGTELPSMGDTIGRVGSTNYAVNQIFPGLEAFYGFN
jgi:hypothetical protein